MTRLGAQLLQKLCQETVRHFASTTSQIVTHNALHRFAEHGTVKIPIG